jgi:hypothetical protein
MAHIFDVGTRAWQPDTAEGWVASEVTDKQVAGDKVTLVFTLETGEVCRPAMLQCCIHPDRPHGLTIYPADKNSRDHPRSHPGWQRPEPAAADEPGHARSQR